MSRPQAQWWASLGLLALAVVGLASAPAGAEVPAGPPELHESASATEPAPAPEAGDDYPYRHASDCSGTYGIYSWCIGGQQYSPRGFSYRNCTDWVAWRMAATNGVDFTNSMRGGRWGNANNWDENAVALGYAVNGTPARGAIAQTNAGSFGHVAWVESVNGDGTVTVEDYNFAGTGAYARRVVPASTYQYIHVQDISPPPPPPPPPVDLSVRVRNGSFESGFTHWTGRQGSGNTNFVAYTDARRAHDGSRFGATNTAGGGSIYNDSAVTMNAGDSIAVGAWVRAQSGTARGRLCAWGLGSTSNESICRTYRVSTTYKYVQLVLNPRGAHNTLRVELYPTNNAGTTFIDTVSMRQN